MIIHVPTTVAEHLSSNPNTQTLSRTVPAIGFPQSLIYEEVEEHGHSTSVVIRELRNKRTQRRIIAPFSVSERAKIQMSLDSIGNTAIQVSLISESITEIFHR